VIPQHLHTGFRLSSIIRDVFWGLVFPVLWSQCLADKGKVHTGAGENFHQVSQLDAPSRPNQIVKHAAWAIALLLSPMSDCDLHSYCELVNQHKQAYTGTS